MAESDGLSLDPIVREARERFKRCEEWESNARKLFLEDLKFANADPDNGYQWPNDIRRNRDIDQRPCLTINKTRQYNLNVINDAKQNKPSVKIRPVGNGATYEAAQVYEGLVRHIEYISNAQVAYDTATVFQVEGGIGYWRIVTDYAGDDTLDQEIFIKRIKDPLTVYLDPDISEVDGSDARFGFIFDDIPREKAEKLYPKYKDRFPQAALGNADGWIDEDHVRVAEYFRKKEVAETLVYLPDTGKLVPEKLLKQMGEQTHSEIMGTPGVKTRELISHKVEWYLILGEEIVETREWLGKYIPIVRVIGEEVLIDGELDRKGHTRALKDPQRMYNYYSSSAVEYIALQGKSPYVAPVKAIEGVETYWETANTVNHSILPYNHRDDDGHEIPAPERQNPPTMPQAYVNALQVAAEEMRMVSGQYQADMGEPGNEKSGKAIQERQRQGDTATYHFIDNLAIGIRFTGRILIDLIPKVYDTQRIRRILAEDGTDYEITIDPNAQQAFLQKQDQVRQSIQLIFNPNIGEYDVEADIGPAYATRRQEAFNAFSQIAAQNSDLMHVIGDLMFKYADFPGADEIAERLKNLVPPQALGGAPNAQIQQMQGEMQKLQTILTNTIQQLAEEKMKVRAKDLDLKDKTEQKAIDWQYALTDRLKVLLPTILNPKDIAQMVHDLNMQERQSNLNMLETAHSAEVTAANQPQEQPQQ